jgi:drug/metabolite transporter (DMT)-like permease
MQIFNSWQANLIGYLISMVIFSHHYKRAVKNSSNETASTIFLQLVGAVVMVLFIPFAPIKFPLTLAPYLLLIAASVFYAINNKLQTVARKNLEISTFSVISQLSFVFLTIFSLVFLGEKFSVNKLLAIVLILGGNGLLIISAGKLLINKHMVTAVLSALTGSLGVFISVGVSRQFNLPLYIALTFILPAIILKFSKSITLKEIKLSGSVNLKNYLLAGGFWGAAILFSLRAMQLGEVSTVAPLQALTVLLNVILGYLLMNERGLIIRKVTAAMMIILSVYVNVA